MTWFITAGAVLCAAVAIAACVAVTSHRRVSIVTVGIGLATLGLGSFAVLVVGVVRGLDLFGIAHMLYLQATLAVPLLGQARSLAGFFALIFLCLLILLTLDDLSGRNEAD